MMARTLLIPILVLALQAASATDGGGSPHPVPNPVPGEEPAIALRPAAGPQDRMS